MDKKEISLIVSDVDNTVIDLFDTWGKETDKAFKKLADSRNIKQEELEKEIIENVSFPDIVHNLAAVIKNTPSLKKSAEKFERSDAKIVHKWQKTRDDMKLYKGVVSTVRKAKKAGAKFVFYSDGPVSSLVFRMAKSGFPVELIDGIYAQPDIKKDGSIGRIPPLGVKGKLADYYKALDGRIHTLNPDKHKPDPAALKKIAKDMGETDMGKVLMIGDNLRSDCRTGNNAGAVSVWQKQGCDISKTAVELFYRMAPGSNYPLGMKKMTECLKDPQNVPDIVLDKGFADINKYVNFVSLKKDRLNILDKKLLKKKSR